MSGLVGRKVGMTQILDPLGDFVPVTVLQAGPVTVTKVLKKDSDGYDAIQVGFENAGEKKLNRPQAQYFSKKQIVAKRHLREFRLGSDQKADQFKVGQELTASFFQPGDFVDVQGTSIGKGFQGGTKRWGMKGGPSSHGSMYHRRPGSGGASSFPSRTWPGHHMPGRMGNVTRTVQNLLVLKVLKEDSAILVKGSVPGARNAIVAIRKSLKRKPIDLAQLKDARGAGEKKDGGKKAPSKKTGRKK